MKTKYTFIYSFSLALLICQNVWSQSPSDSIVKPVKTEKFGLRAGIDLYRLTRTFVDDKYRGLELAGDFRISKNYYIAAELGTENITIPDDRVNFTTSGSYIKAGIDINFYDNWLDMENMIYAGFRYAFSTFSQDINSYKIYIQDPYFGEAPPVPGNISHNGLTAQWIELVVGAKAELLHNFYAGFSIRLNRMIYSKEPDNFENLYVTGFNRTYGGSSFGIGVNYTITYFLPIYKKEAKSQVKK